VSLAARHLEEAGIPTVIIGSALDIVEHCGVPRYVFTDFPLGNPCGKPFDTDMQLDILATGMDLLERAVSPRTTVRTPYQWSSDETWRRRYLEVREKDRAKLEKIGKERRSLRQTMKTIR